MIQLYSTELRKKVPFAPRTPGQVRMYVCGPTVYASCHVGHARPAVVFDSVRRYLEFAGYAVTFISNITDIDDKIIARASELGLSCAQLASRYQDEYEADMTALGVRAPTIRPKATEHIPEMIALIRGLEEKGVAYATTRGVWFDVSKCGDYGHVSGRRIDDENTEHRVEEDTEKRNPQDFALWKFSKPGEPEWDSPWGKGRPGWHIECSAMSGKFCDWELDIHGGGADLAFPHHENEAAQSECFSGRQFARYWMHNGFITVAKENTDGGDDEVKMGKSKGNAFWLRQAFREAAPAALRLWILGTHYRAPLLYKPELIKTAQTVLERIYNCLEHLGRILGEDGLRQAGQDRSPASDAMNKATAAMAAFRESMDDDFNTPQALAVLHGLLGEANTLGANAPKRDAAAMWNALAAILGVLGLPLERPASGGGKSDELIRLMITLRTEARGKKDFALSDAIRDRLAAIGVTLSDRSGETTWTVS